MTEQHGKKTSEAVTWEQVLEGLFFRVALGINICQVEVVKSLCAFDRISLNLGLTKKMILNKIK